MAKILKVENGRDVNAGYVGAQWPERFLAIAREWLGAADAGRRDACRLELWTIANLAIQKYVGIHVRNLGFLDPEDARDISSEKTLDLLRRLERHEWEPGEYTPAQLCAFLATVARNGVLDQRRLRMRETQAWWDEPRTDDPARARFEPVDPADAAKDVEAGESARAIIECFRLMTPRARLVCLLRIFYELSSEEVAAHPDLRTTAAAVDMMLMRCRKHLRRCTRNKGFDPATLPEGTLTSLWEMVMAESSASEGAQERW